MESYNVDAIQYLCKVDSNLEKIIKIVGKYSINIRNDPFQSLVESIIYQQLAGRAANAIYNRFINYYNNKQITPARILNSPNDIFSWKTRYITCYRFRSKKSYTEGIFFIRTSKTKYNDGNS